MKNKKGFTLIELLAVIVILAIIALIATPIVLGIINDSKESSSRVSATYIITAVEQSYNVAFALNGGNVPTVSEVKERFNMDNAVWVEEDGKQKIKTTDSDVVCDVNINSNELSVSCSRFNISSATMEISS